MLIICTEFEREIILEQCNAVCTDCTDCVFKHIQNCPIDKRDIVTTEEIEIGHVVGFPPQN